MKIIVCIKQVPDTTEVKLDPKTGTLIREGVPSIMNPDDKAGLEAALRIKDEHGAHVSVISMGPFQAREMLREALAMGADAAYLITDRAFAASDTWATSSILAAAISKLDYDLIITGRQAIDGDTAQVGPETAEHLGIPNISYAEEVRVDGDTLVVKRQFEDYSHLVRAKFPVLITALGELNKPRYMTPGAIFDAWREAEIVEWNRPDVPVDDSNIGYRGSPTRVAKSFPKTMKAPGMKIEEGVEESVEFIFDKLKEKYLL
ncbi:MAG TPA: electron transfer flavoprotein subunit beta/FixA family protein [Anaerolineaceae bacterium]|nr:electron transfer flavoprotein subunit beta/FixA family protein [Anaerolineaceae bacterium]HQC64589.1 electron transfer flavoprotein subunit beta/FixA family protein [Anaerolineaceae bacterium]HQL92642.1 electron transfer flavoprotein subunit beta/FixA family protein [Anaerolineaceae bacterium]HQN68513.1 electron transfer flavoprotein subunit beta/FixA family protein [Anaerolineaceae bacterium]